MARRHINIPVFIPELACPHQCVFCDQRKITGQQQLPTKAFVNDTIERHLQSIDASDVFVLLAFFGGNFTGLPLDQQETFLSWIQPYINGNGIKGIRVSTRPDYIRQEVLELLKKYNVSHIELGAQSLDEEVLQKSGRGHTVGHVEQASRMIKEYGFQLGLQMMTGLPGDTHQKAMATARKIVALKADETRIYPTLVIQGTALHRLYQNGLYVPQSLDASIALSAELIDYFNLEHVNVLRVGLFASESLLKGEYIAGPFHANYMELVKSYQWLVKLQGANLNGGTIYVSPGDINHAVGFNAVNKKTLEKRYPGLKFKVDHALVQGEWRC